MRQHMAGSNNAEAIQLQLSIYGIGVDTANIGNVTELLTIALYGAGDLFLQGAGRIVVEPEEAGS